MNTTKQLQGFRVIIRGTEGSGNKARRVRRVRTVHVRTQDEAPIAVERQDKAVLSGLRNVYLSVLPPCSK